MPADFLNKRQLAHEIEEQLKTMLPGISQQFVEILYGAGVDLVDGTPLGIRAGKVAEAMAQANLARRVRDIDGYRKWLCTASAYVLGGLLEIGEPVILPRGHGLNPFRRYSGPSFADTEIYRAILAERQAVKETQAAESIAQRYRDMAAPYPSQHDVKPEYDVKNCPIRLDGYPDVVCDKGMGHPGPCHPISTVVAPAPAFRKLGDDDTGADLVAELQRLGAVPVDPSRRVVSIEDNDEAPE